MSRLCKQLMRNMGRAIGDFGLIAEGDRILVAVSGGKDSLTLLDLLMRLQRRAPVRFELVAANVDQGQPCYQAATLRSHFEALGIEYHMIRRNTFETVQRLSRPGKISCPVCARLRRGILYRVAPELGCNSIALGHHRDDLIETLLLSELFSGAIRSMPPKLISDDRRNRVIRPLCYCAEETIRAYAQEQRFPVIPCSICSSQENQQRQRVKRLIAELAAEHPAVPGNLLHALEHVVPSHLLDRRLTANTP